MQYQCMNLLEKSFSSKNLNHLVMGCVTQVFLYFIKAVDLSLPVFDVN